MDEQIIKEQSGRYMDILHLSPIFSRKKFAGSWSDETEMLNWYNHLRLAFWLIDDAGQYHDDGDGDGDHVMVSWYLRIGS